MIGFLKPFYSLSFWFSVYPVGFTRWFEFIIWIVSAVLCIAGAVVYFYWRRKAQGKDLKFVFRRLGTCLMWAGVTMLGLWWLVWQGVPYLSMRFAWLLWVIGYGYWVYDVWRFWKRELPAKQLFLQERMNREKWLPKRKK